jgi:hypothetical protein
MATYQVQQRQRAIQQGMEFIYDMACTPEHFAECGQELLYFFHKIASTSLDRKLRKLAREMVRERFRQWQRNAAPLPADADSDTIIVHYHEDWTAELLGVPDAARKRQLREAARRFSADDFLWFNPFTEAPASDVPNTCHCGTWNPRGSKRCGNPACKAKLVMMTRYEVWYYSLTRTYCAHSYGLLLGAHYLEVLKWLPALYPYLDRQQTSDLEFVDSIYAISHLVYTLNDYGVYNLSPRWFPREYEFLKANLHEAIDMDNPDMMGEILDSLMSLGLTDRHPLIRQGIDFLLAKQNSDGSWGDAEPDYLYGRYHPTWTAIDGLREFAWRGEGLKFPEILPLLKQWARRDYLP